MPKKKPPTTPIQPARHPQKALNDLVYQLGVKLREQDGPRMEALTVAGIDPESVTDLMWDLAEESLNKRLKAEAEGRIIKWVVEPSVKQQGGGDVLQWESECGRYCLTKIYRGKDVIYGAEQGPVGKRHWIESDPKLGSGYARYYPTLQDAANVVIRHHLKKFGLGADELKHNTDRMVELENQYRPEPESAGIIASPDYDDTKSSIQSEDADEVSASGNENEELVPMTTAEKTETVMLKAAAVRKMFLAMDLPADEWSARTMQKKVNDHEKIRDYTNTGGLPEEGTSQRRTYDAIQEAHAEGVLITVLPDGADPENPPKPGPKPKDKGKGSPNAKPARADKTTKPENPKVEKSPKTPNAPKMPKGTKTQGASCKVKVRPGSMIGIVIDLLGKASADKPISRDEILAVLMKKWPDHNEKSVRDSIGWYISTMPKKHGLTVQKNGKGGFWIDDCPVVDSGRTPTSRGSESETVVEQCESVDQSRTPHTNGSMAGLHSVEYVSPVSLVVSSRGAWRR